MCFSWAWLGNFLVWLVIVVTIVLVLRVAIPWALSLISFTIDARAIQIINYILGAIVLIYIIWFVIGIASCLSGGGGLHLPRMSP